MNIRYYQFGQNAKFCKQCNVFVYSSAFASEGENLAIAN